MKKLILIALIGVALTGTLNFFTTNKYVQQNQTISSDEIYPPAQFIVQL